MYDEYTSPTSISGDPVFFQDDKTYWSPASNTRGLYKQLSSKKYREIVKQDIRYVTWTMVEDLVHVCVCVCVGQVYI